MCWNPAPAFWRLSYVLVRAFPFLPTMNICIHSSGVTIVLYIIIFTSLSLMLIEALTSKCGLLKMTLALFSHCPCKAIAVLSRAMEFWGHLDTWRLWICDTGNILGRKESSLFISWQHQEREVSAAVLVCSLILFKPGNTWCIHFFIVLSRYVKIFFIRFLFVNFFVYLLYTLFL